MADKPISVPDLPDSAAPRRPDLDDLIFLGVGWRARDRLWGVSIWRCPTFLLKFSPSFLSIHPCYGKI